MASTKPNTLTPTPAEMVAADLAAFLVVAQIEADFMRLVRQTPQDASTPRRAT